jgi:uncharacterized protein (TIGR02001 family)
MLHKGLIAGLALLLLSASPVLVNAQEDEGEGLQPVSVGAGVSFQSKYVWRGQVLTASDVMQVEANLTLFEMLTVGYWGNLDLEADNGSDDAFTEHDYYVDFTLPLDPLALSVGYIVYQYPTAGGAADDPEWSAEYYVGGALSLPVTDDVSVDPFITFYDDVDDGVGQYLELGVGSSINLVENVTFEPSVTFGYNSNQPIAGLADYHASWSVMTTSLGFDVALGDYISLTPAVNHNLSLDGQYGDSFFAGIGIAAEY